LKVLVGADVSGSMSSELETLSAAVAWLRRSHDVVLACWDTEARITKHIEATGGGTYIQPLWRLAKEQRAEAIVVLTDGYIEGINPMPNVPIIWVITKGGKKPTLRPGDSAIDL
jgi:predicted metal-dependent peptidase